MDQKHQYISSRSNPLVMKAASLSEGKYREREGLFRFDGVKLFREAAACGVKAEYVLICETSPECGEYTELAESLQPQSCICILSEGAFTKISGEKAPEGIITVCKYLDNIQKKIKIEEDLPGIAAGPGRILALESVRDPGNLGTVIRSAAAFGTDTLILSSDCADIYNPRVLRAAMGAVFTRRIITAESMPGAIRVLRNAGRRVYAAALAGNPRRLGCFDISARDVFVIGNEGHGLSGECIAAADEAVIIPMHTGPGVESLNAATAASVIMYEMSKI